MNHPRISFITMLLYAVLLLFVASYCGCAKILAVLPTISKSHFLVSEPLLKELAKRGHSVTVISNFPQKTQVPNYLDVETQRQVVIESHSTEITNAPVHFYQLALNYLNETESVLRDPNVISLVNSNTSFDLLLYEMFQDDVYLGIAHKFNAPSIAISTCLTFSWAKDRFSFPGNPSYIPIFNSPYKNIMPFLARIKNTIVSIYRRILFKHFIEPKSTEIVRRNFGSSTPTVYDLVKNTSLLFINTHFSIFGAQPYPPQVIDISGIHLTQPQRLQQDLNEWLEGSGSAGVVYMSFGSMVRGSTLPADKVAAFLTVFAALPQRVLWKWEDEPPAPLPANVRVAKWMPQRDVLAHPKIRAFISHGGLLGTTEAVVSGVPMLGIPMYGDQPNNVASLIETGAAVRVDYNDIGVATLTHALDALLNDPSYATNAKELSRRFLDRPMSAMDTAVYWTEYVIRHRGAPHLRSAAMHLTWYQYYLLDVIAVCLGVSFLTLVILYYVLKSCLRLFMPKQRVKVKSN